MKGTSQVSLQTLLRRSQSLRVRSWLPETIRALSSKNLADRTLPLWPVRVCWGQEIHMVKLSISTCSNCNLHVSCIAWQKKHLLQLNRDHHWVGVLIIRVQPGTGKHRSAFAAVSPVTQEPASTFLNNLYTYTSRTDGNYNTALQDKAMTRG